MDLGRDGTIPLVLEESLVKKEAQFGAGFPFFPAGAELLHELRLNILVCRWPLLEEITDPTDGALLVLDEDRHLPNGIQFGMR